MEANTSQINNSIKQFRVIITQIILYISLYINFIMLFTFFRKDSFREDTRYILFAHMLFVDTFQLVFMDMSQLFYYFSILMPAGACIVMSVLLGTLSYNTPLTLTAMCLERYVAICMPLRHGQISTVKRTLDVILIIWLIGSIPSIRDFIIVIAMEPKTFYVEKNFCSYDLMIRSIWQSYVRSVMAMLYFGVMLGTVAFTYVKIMEVARTVSADSSASKARHTVLLHTFQLVLCLAVLVSPFVEMAIFQINQNIISHVIYFNFITFNILPRCLSSFIYGVRDDKFREVFLFYITFGLVKKALKKSLKAATDHF
ncbi:odorant receptor 131-2-like [Erpetoichthys calabaricus]|uniref:odorant receptor 131-2-like n=1 Tax=Erpetoichthys calabaricus TaxID=27687 RepID=UPI00223469DC|nr:odorant receptor 131-2-like [Erpetoichthys calabaricus]